MANVINTGSIGASLGSSLGQGLERLTNHKIDELVKSKQQKAFMEGFQSLGYTPEESKQISLLPADIQKEIVKQRLSEPSNQAYAQALGAITGYNTMPEQQAAHVQNNQQSPQLNDLFESNTPLLNSLRMVSPNLFKESASIQQTSLNSQEKPVIQKQKTSSLLRPGLNQQQATELAKLALKKEKATKEDISERFKATQPIRKEILDNAKAARNDIKDLDRLQELEAEGKLDTPGYIEFLKRSGFDIPALMNPGSEEFQKISANFLKNAKQYFGARVSNYEVEQFLKTIPSLSQTPEGRKRVISNLKYLSRASLEYNTALKEVIHENQGVPPFDLAEQVDDKVEKRMDKIADLFKKDLAKEVPQGQNKLITGLQAALGDITGLPNKLVKGAGKLLSGGIEL